MSLSKPNMELLPTRIKLGGVTFYLGYVFLRVRGTCSCCDAGEYEKLKIGYYQKGLTGVRYIAPHLNGYVVAWDRSTHGCHDYSSKSYAEFLSTLKDANTRYDELMSQNSGEDWADYNRAKVFSLRTIVEQLYNVIKIEKFNSIGKSLTKKERRKLRVRLI